MVRADREVSSPCGDSNPSAYTARDGGSRDTLDPMTDKDKITVAGVQMASGPNVHANLSEAERLIGEAVQAGAKLVVLPENFAFMGHKDKDTLEHREGDEGGPLQAFLARQAERHGIWLAGGTIPMRAHDEHKQRAACLVYDPKGRRVARYDKIHLFDVEIVDTHEQYRESRVVEPGEEVVVVETPFGVLGLAICYDLRFPEIFRKLVDQGMTHCVLPAAFTAITGRAHWETLVRARAIENLCYVVAAAQGGYHVNGRETWGHSMIVDPWGLTLGVFPQGAGIVVAEADRKRLKTARKNFPVLQHRRFGVSARGAGEH